jgi:CRP-like cAMP-binding protein
LLAVGQIGDAMSPATFVDSTARLSLDGFARLAALGERAVFARGSELMHQGEEADCLYVILAGGVSVVREHPHLSTPIVLAQLGPGEIVGEMGLLDGEPRSATVTAIEDTVTVAIPGGVLNGFIAEHPDMYGSLSRVLSKRLRATNDFAASLAADAPRSSE